MRYWYSSSQLLLVGILQRIISSKFAELNHYPSRSGLDGRRLLRRSMTPWGHSAVTPGAPSTPGRTYTAIVLNTHYEGERQAI